MTGSSWNSGPSVSLRRSIANWAARSRAAVLAVATLALAACGGSASDPCGGFTLFQNWTADLWLVLPPATASAAPTDTLDLAGHGFGLQTIAYGPCTYTADIESDGSHGTCSGTIVMSTASSSACPAVHATYLVDPANEDLTIQTIGGVEGFVVTP